MAVLTKAAFLSKWNSLFADNATREISELDLRDFRQDISDSFLGLSDNFIDDDTFATASPTKVPSSESVKAYVDATAGGVQSTTVSISSAEILALNTTPKLLVAAPGAGNAIRLISVSMFYTFVTTAYATNVNTAIEYQGTPESPAAQDTVIINATQSKVLFMIASPGLNNLVDVENKAVILTIETGDPTTGDGTLDIIVQYKIIAIP